MQELFVDLVDSSLPSGNSRRSVHGVQAIASLCCVSSLTCLTMSKLLIPFCYDRFNADYFLPDGSYGNVVGGSYETSSGDSANLLSGDYTLKDGTIGNIYANNEAAKPNTATLRLPAQFTGHGVGSTIPASVLGDVATVTYTTVLPGKTGLPNTISASTESAQVIGGSVVPAITQTATLASSTLVSTELATTETTTLGGSNVVSVIRESTISTTLADSTTISVIPATSMPVSTIPATTIKASTIQGTTVDATIASLTTTIPAGQSTGTVSSNSGAANSTVNITQSSASSLDPESLALWVVKACMIFLVACFGFGIR